MAINYYQTSSRARLPNFTATGYLSAGNAWMGVAAVDSTDKLAIERAKKTNSKKISKKEYEDLLGKLLSESSSSIESRRYQELHKSPDVQPVAVGGSIHPGSPTTGEGRAPQPGDGRVAEGKAKSSAPIQLDDIAKAVKLPDNE